MTHTCHAQGCEVPVPPRMFMCRAHWYALPWRMREAIWRAYVPGQEVTKTPSPAYLRNTHAAIDWLARKEGLRS